MDPTENLKRQREIAALLVNGVDNIVTVSELASELAELVQALDEWIIKGAFLPEPWDNAQWRKIQS